ncbi:hypothetical protein LZQ00_10865 [Sphingobacterium sp. SRCM116780]|uniref:hypothetical protein n=1 Tax=Sphingobacterium sp. SRCM116780 TaxID=2907623 RepID=UPI001F3D70DB|nr:hypothetical protein [Sphingobacterium sp. SRCM116780]UIR54777.1 hypothetical protein LZQ00_10865 [Sphingobacterium sp. SRCM116780]
MNNLKELLQKNHFQDNTFAQIAELLLNHSLLTVNEKSYRLTEIEFYWNDNKDHQDKSTYIRNHTENLQAGQLFFHYSGFDIAMDNEFGYGGILIRAVYDLSNNKHYKGPMVSCMHIFSGVSVFGGHMDVRLEEKSLDPPLDVFTKPKIGLGKNAIEGGFDSKDYNYSIKLLKK